MSALTRMAFSDHRKVEVTKDDLIIISATPIPGNEKSVSNVVNELFKIGAEVIYKSLAEVHVSGHACQEELKLILALTKPKFFIPVHGEHRHLVLHKELAQKVGIPEKNSFVLSNGQVLELDSKPQKSQALFRQVKYLSTVLESAMSEISYFVTENIFHRTDLLLSLLQYHTTVKKSFQNLMLFQEVSCMYARPNRLSRALNTLPAKVFRIVLANVIWIGQL